VICRQGKTRQLWAGFILKSCCRNEKQRAQCETVDKTWGGRGPKLSRLSTGENKPAVEVEVVEVGEERTGQALLFCW